MNHYMLPGAALISLVSGGANAALTPIGTFTESASTGNPSPAGSTGLGPLGAVGGIGGPMPFSAPVTGTLVMTVGPLEVDGMPVGFPGDVYQAFVDGTSLGFTPGVPLFGTQFSIGTFTTPVTAGAHTFDINDQILSYIGSPSPYGSALPPPDNTVPASFNPTNLTVVLAEELPAAVPEPRSLAVIASAFLGFGWLWYRRERGRPAP